MNLRLNGDIISDGFAWLYDFFEEPYIAPKHIREALDRLPAGEDLILEITSPGGDAFAGFEMYGMLKGAKAHTEAHVIGLAASAATTLMCGCDRVLASPVSQIMIHQPSTYTAGDLDEHKDSLRFLESIEESILNGYELKCAGKTSRDKLKRLVDKSTWMPPQEAIEIGLVDGLLDVNEEILDLQGMALTAQVAAGVTNALGGDRTAQLLARYAEQVTNVQADPVPGHAVTVDSWKETREGLAPADQRTGILSRCDLNTTAFHGNASNGTCDTVLSDHTILTTTGFVPDMPLNGTISVGTTAISGTRLTINAGTGEMTISEPEPEKKMADDWRHQARIDLERAKVRT